MGYSLLRPQENHSLRNSRLFHNRNLQLRAWRNAAVTGGIASSGVPRRKVEGGLQVPPPPIDEEMTSF